MSRDDLPGVVLISVIVILFAMNLHETVVEIQCARNGYPTARRVSLTKIACFKVENGSTVQR